MNDATPSLKQLNRTFIGSVLFIDIVGYSMRTVPDQQEMKEVFITMLGDAVQNVAASERIMVDTGDGAGIAFLGDPEDALFAALSLRDAVQTMQIKIGEPGFVRMGINLGPLKIVRDINGHTNMIGDGVNDAQRVMSFSEPGQVMVSHSYFDIISRFSRDYTQLFVYEGTRHDKHVREHEVYRFGPAHDTENLAEKLRDRSRARGSSSGNIGAETPAMPPPAAVTGKNQAKEVSAPGGKSISRGAMIATAVGALSVVGAVWSWTSKPAQPPAEPVAVSAPVATASAVAVPASTGKEAASSSTSSHASSAKAGASVSGAASHPQLALAAASPTPSEKNASQAEASAPAAKPGTLKLAIQPWGEIYVDGSKRGVTPPMKSLTLAPGKHKIEIRNGEFTPYKETIEVKSGAETTVQFVF